MRALGLGQIFFAGSHLVARMSSRNAESSCTEQFITNSVLSSILATNSVIRLLQMLPLVTSTLQ